MNGYSDSFEDIVEETPLRGSSFLSHDGIRQVWQCPYCDHTLQFTEDTIDAAELGANSHITRQHKVERTIVVFSRNESLPETRPSPEDPDPGVGLARVMHCGEEFWLDEEFLELRSVAHPGLRVPLDRDDVWILKATRHYEEGTRHQY